MPYRRTRKYDAERQRRAQATRERNRLERPAPDYPAELPDLRMRITVERMDFGRDMALPQPGAWVSDLGNDGEYPQIAKVRDAYIDSVGNALLDLVMYSPSGRKLGRTSPSAGGPTGFEPCCCADWWIEIEEPDFDALGKKRFGYRELLIPLRHNARANARP